MRRHKIVSQNFKTKQNTLLKKKVPKIPCQVLQDKDFFKPNTAYD